MKKIIMVICCISLLGCITQEQRRAQAEARRAQGIERLSKDCEDLGYERDTAEFKACRLKLLEMAANSANAKKPNSVIVRHPSTTTCNSYGGTTTCDNY